VRTEGWLTFRFLIQPGEEDARQIHLRSTCPKRLHRLNEDTRLSHVYDLLYLSTRTRTMIFVIFYIQSWEVPDVHNRNNCRVT